MLRLYARAMAAVSSTATAIWLLVGNVVFVLLSLLEPVFFREIIDVLVGFEAGGEPSYAPLVQVLAMWTAVGVVLLSVRGAVSLGTDRLAHRSHQALRDR